MTMFTTMPVFQGLLFMLFTICTVSTEVATDIATHSLDATTLSSQCSCGFRDPRTKVHWTDAIIIYFNETSQEALTVDDATRTSANLASDVPFQISSYLWRAQKGWNVLFRQGAKPQNVGVRDTPPLPWLANATDAQRSLEMTLDAAELETHQSIGSEVRTLRQDLLYGSFRASMRSPLPWSTGGGSAMSMFVRYNESVNVQLDLLNMDNASEARVMQTVNGEWPEDTLALNYSIIERGQPPDIPARSAWDFLEVGFDWNADHIDFWVETNKTRHIDQDQQPIPQIPQPLYLAHWSTGDAEYMEGPPTNRSAANVRWIRAFFNSSLMDTTAHHQFDERCNADSNVDNASQQSTIVCSTENFNLRGSTGYTSAATEAWTPEVIQSHIRKVAGYVAAAFSVFGVASLFNAFVRRTPWRKLLRIKAEQLRRQSIKSVGNSIRETVRQSIRQSIRASMVAFQGYESIPDPDNGTEANHQDSDTSPPAWVLKSLAPRHHLGAPPSMTPVAEFQAENEFPGFSVPCQDESDPKEGSAIGRTHDDAHRYKESISSGCSHSSEATGTEPPGWSDVRNRNETKEGISRRVTWRPESEELYAPDSKTMERVQEKPESTKSSTASIQFGEVVYNAGPPKVPTEPTVREMAMEKGPGDPLTNSSTGDAPAPASSQAPVKSQDKQKRIDHLAGLLVISCIGVTFRHFSLTFWPYITEGYGNTKHFAADEWLAWIMGPYVLTPLWIGPFFVTSCRFLAQRYLATGKLNDVANKMLLRAPRMLIPCFIFMIFEYFLIELGLTSQLESLPSVSWSLWPRVTAQGNFGVFLNEMVELAYMIPNGAPEIVSHFCVGVLWTIPVQLQFSYVVLMAAVLIRDVKNPTKRFGFYIVTMVAGWYANSWSSCHWLGLMLADLDITYHWVKRVQARWWLLYPILFFATLMILASPLVLLFNSAFFSFPTQAYEHGIMPDIRTGRPIMDVVPGGIEAAYPDYFAPSAAVLTFSAALQVIVELSTWTQKLLSLPAITFLHPHVMTIYLLHGFVFWSLGSWIAIGLAQVDTPYWANLLVVLVSCYGVIFMLTIVITPLSEFVTKESTKNIWRKATDQPVPKLGTTAPFTVALVLGRIEGPSTQASV